MDSGGFKPGDLVWAKMKGYPPWPAKIAKPQCNAKKPSKYKKAYFVYFFGSNNFAWILAENITLHSESKFESLKDRKMTTAYKNAVDDLKVCLKSSKKDKSTTPKLQRDSAKKPRSRVVNTNNKVIQSLRVSVPTRSRVVKVFKTVAKKPARKAVKFPHTKVSKKRVSHPTGSRVVNVFKTVTKKPARKVVKFPHTKVSKKSVPESGVKDKDYSKYKFPKLKESIDRMEELIFTQFECLKENLRQSVELMLAKPTDKNISFTGLDNITERPEGKVLKFSPEKISEKKSYESDINSEDDYSKYNFLKLKESLDKTEELVFSLNMSERT